MDVKNRVMSIAGSSCSSTKRGLCPLASMHSTQTSLKTSIHEDVTFPFRNFLSVRTEQTYQGSITP